MLPPTIPPSEPEQILHAFREPRAVVIRADRGPRWSSVPDLGHIFIQTGTLHAHKPADEPPPRYDVDLGLFAREIIVTAASTGMLISRMGRH